MYIIKNALRCIARAKGRNALIGVIALVIAVSACLGLSIRQAAESAKASALEEMSVTATISYDRSAMMNSMSGSRPGGMGGSVPDMPQMGGGKNPFENAFNSAENYITQVNSAMNLTVVLQMLGVGLLLTLIASFVSVLFIMRYDPLRILANRD